MKIIGQLQSVGETLTIKGSDGDLIDIDGLPIHGIRKIASSFMDQVSITIEPVAVPVAQSTSTRYTASADGLTVTDSQTGLVWQKAGSSASFNYEDAEAYIASLNEERHGGFDDWRLPTDHELCSIVDRSRFSPAIDPTFSCKNEWYWTSTALASSSVFAWFVSFRNGHVGNYHRYDSVFVRAVRGASPASQ